MSHVHSRCHVHTLSCILQHERLYEYSHRLHSCTAQSTRQVSSHTSQQPYVTYLSPCCLVRLVAKPSQANAPWHTNCTIDHLCGVSAVCLVTDNVTIHVTNHVCCIPAPSRWAPPLFTWHTGRLRHSVTLALMWAMSTMAMRAMLHMCVSGKVTKWRKCPGYTTYVSHDSRRHSCVLCHLAAPDIAPISICMPNTWRLHQSFVSHSSLIK